MKLQLSASPDQNAFTGHGPGFVEINRVRHETSLIVLAERVIEPWPVANVAQLAAEHFEFLADIGADVVLLGTGMRLQFPHPRLTQALTDARIGLECMDTGAACRTFNILAQEGRRVAAALIVG